MTALTVQPIVEAGLEAAYVAATSAGDTIKNTGKEILHVVNADASPTTVTVTAQTTSKNVDGFGDLTRGNITVVVGAGEEHFIGPFPTTAFNNTSSNISITYTNDTSITVAALQLTAAK